MVASRISHKAVNRRLPDMNLDDLSTFVRVAESGSVTKAAELLDKPQPVLSRKIALLERECGGHLFQRTGRGVVLTALGERVLSRARLILSEAELMVGEARQNGPVGLRGEVTIGLIPSLGRTVSQALITRVHRTHPGIFLRVFEMFSGELSASLERGMVDVAVLLRGGTNLLHEEPAFCTWETHLIGPPGDEITSRPEITFRELEGVPLVLSSAPSGARIQIDEIAKAQGVPLHVVVEANSSPVTLQLIATGVGYSLSPLGPLSLMSLEVQEGNVQATRLVEPGISRTLVLRQGERRNAAIAEVVRLMTEVIEEFKLSQSAAAN